MQNHKYCAMCITSSVRVYLQLHQQLQLRGGNLLGQLQTLKSYSQDLL